jgi:hypothetical protein
MSSLVRYWSSVNCLGTHLAETFYQKQLPVLNQSLYHFPSNASQVSPSVAHDQIVHSFGSFIVGGLFWPPRTLIISNALSVPLYLSSPCCHSAIGRRILPKCIHKVSIDFLGGHYFLFLKQVLNDGSDFNFLHFV